MRVNPRRAWQEPELVILSALALLTRCWGVLDPRAVVWDEVHFERFAGAYFTGRYYVDVHPPFAKLLLAGAARLLGVSGAALAAVEPTPVLRLLPAIAGALIIPVVYLLLRELRASRRVATLASALLLVDNALLVESRFILTDSMLILFVLAAVLLFVSARRRIGVSRWALLGTSAAVAGMAAATKWTGLSALGLILLCWSIDTVRQRLEISVALREGILFAVVPVAIYAGAFAVHFALLPLPGPGVSPATAEVSTKLDGPARNARPTSLSFPRRFVELHRIMLAVNVGWASDTNNGASPWFTWPIAKHSMGFWSPTKTGEEPERWIVLFANPIVWLGSLLGAALVVAAVFFRRGKLAPHRNALVFLTAGYLMNFVPFAFITRPMYLYHYFIALIFLVMVAAIGVGALAGWANDDDEHPWRFPTRQSATLYVAVIALAATTFAYLAPMSYGWPLSASAVVHRRWVIERRM